MHDFKGWTALITGASAGFGRELALQLALELGGVILVARRQERLEELKEELLKIRPGLQVEIMAIDLSLPEEMVRLMNEISTRSLTVDLLINNAGLGDYGIFEKTPWEKLDQMLMVNMMALTGLCRFFIPEMVERRRGAIMNVSSIASYLPIPTFAVYAATKAYVTSLSDALHAELIGTGVTVTAVCPGPSHTEFGSVAIREPQARAMESPECLHVPPAQVVREAIEATQAGRPRVIPGLKVRIAIALLRLVPLEWMQWMHRLVIPARAARQRKSGDSGSG